MIDGSKYHATIADIKDAVAVTYSASVTDTSPVSVFSLKADGSWSASHSEHCVHTYSFLKQRYDEKGEVAYIYDPRLVGEGGDDSILDSDTLSIIQEVLAESNKYTIVDWRELIFLMARDYRKYRTEEDFLERVRKNNMYNDYDSWYPKGYTGYETYYVDFEMNVSQGVIAY